jgi:hypothetical protein
MFMVPLRVKQSERGAVLIHAAVGMVALIAFSALVVDYGVLWVSRHQAQNAADAAAHAAAEQLSFGDPTNFTAAKNAALAVAAQNKVWGLAPDVTAADITFPACPPGAPGVPDTCVRADVFRNQRAGGSPLPMFFGQIVGLTQQGVRATATAQMFVGDAATCVKPFVIPDKWTEVNDGPGETIPWSPVDTFETMDSRGNPLPNPDVYTPPTANSCGSGFCLPANYGLQITLKNGNPQNAIAPGFFHPVDFSNPTPSYCSQSTGANCYSSNISQCYTTPIGPGSVLTDEPGNMVGPTKSGMDALIALDPGAYWDSSANGGLGAPAGGCMAAGTCSVSPRLVAVAAFDPALYELSRQTGRDQVTITHVLGFFINAINNQGDVTGYFTYYPALARGTSTLTSSADFLRTVILVR